MSRRIARSQARKLNHPVVEQEEEEVYNGKLEETVSKNSSIPFASKYSFTPSKIIYLFEETFHGILLSPSLQEHIQIVKGNLYNRDYITAFENDDKRFAYASRWSPARALSYSSLFGSLLSIRDLLQDPDSEKNVLCVGGGASSELVGLAAVFCELKGNCPTSDSKLNLSIIDIADWSTVVNSISRYIKSKWLYDGTKFDTQFILDDILSLSSEIDYSKLDLVTLLFTTNELFCEKRTETIKFLQKLNSECKKGSYLLIAESAGSYSHITIGTKKFPVQFLIDTVLSGKPGENNGSWEIIDESESCWYRVDQREIKYNMKLENMRFFYRLYRKN